jgi:membrane peptidoglycan carboxypeptidase
MARAAGARTSPAPPYACAVKTSPASVRIAFGLVVAMLAGVVLAGLAFPVLGGIGLIGKSAADDLTPQKPPAVDLAQSTTILDRNGGVIATLFTENRKPVKLGQVPKLARQALIAIEDSRFYEHRGLDVKGTARALARNSSSGSVQQGGSTLTQQYVKNILIASASTEEGQKAAIQRSLRRKIQEARHALYLEEHMTKDQILEGYLNIAYYGGGVYGIGTAARHYFSVPVQKLTLAQGALLAGMLQNPRKYDPVDNPRTSVARRNTVLARMLELGIITQAAHDRARREPLRLKISEVLSGCEAPGVSAPFFCDYVRRYLENGPAGEVLGETRQERQQRLLAGGLTIHTTLDPVVQRAAQQAVNEKVPPNDPFGAVAVADTVEPGTGAVRAMAVDRVFGSKRGQTKVNFALGGSAGFQGGSTFKAFVLARALQMGISPKLTLHAPVRYCPTAFTYLTGSGKCPSNAGDSESGVFNMVSATWASVNTYFIQLEERTGLVTPPELAEQLGVRQIDGTFSGGKLPKIPSFVLGSPEVSPLAMAAAYAAFAAKGKYCEPHPVTKIVDSNGRPLDLDAPNCSQPLEANVANTLTGMLRGVIDGRGGHRTGAGASIGRPAAGKTGTTNDSEAAWFVGYTPELSTAVWVGKSTPTPMVGVTINGRYYRQVYGGGIPASIWRQLMSEALRGQPVQNFPPITKAIGEGLEGTLVPDVRAMSVGQASAILQDAGFGVGVGPVVDDASISAGLVVGTSPAGGSKAPAGSTIVIRTSSGRGPTPTPPPVTARPTPRPTPKPTKTRPTTSPTPSPTVSPTPSATASDPPGNGKP